jgi:hypothetical protein
MDPPVTAGGVRRTKWTVILNELRGQPGKWARIAVNTKNTGYASMIKNGRLGGADPGEFEAVARRSTEGEDYDLYARYVGAD